MSPFKTKQGVLFNQIHSQRSFILKDISGSELSPYARLDAGVARVARKKPIDFRVLVGRKKACLKSEITVVCVAWSCLRVFCADKYGELSHGWTKRGSGGFR